VGERECVDVAGGKGEGCPTYRPLGVHGSVGERESEGDVGVRDNLQEWGACLGNPSQA
jgi:hypothetical protein